MATVVEAITPSGNCSINLVVAAAVEVVIAVALVSVFLRFLS